MDYLFSYIGVLYRYSFLGGTMFSTRKPSARSFLVLTFALLLTTIQGVPATQALGNVITNDGSSLTGWSGSAALLVSGGNPGAVLGFSKNENISRAYGSSGSDISGAVIQIDAYFTSTQDFIKIIWGENAGCNSAGGLQVVLGPATNSGSGNAIAGWGGIQGGVNCIYGASPDGTIAGLGASGNWSINTWYKIKVAIGSTSTSYYVNDVLIQTRATSLPTQNIIFIGGDDRNGYGFTNGVLVDNISIGGSAATTFSYSALPMVGSAVTFSATVTPSSSTGTVTFKDSSDNTLCTTAALSSGIGSCNTWVPSTPATYSVRAIYSGDASYLTSTSTTSNIVVAQGAQSISFTAPADLDISATPPALSATATSGLTVAFTSATTGVCTVSGTAITLITTGTCTINANQAGNSNYTAASQVQRSFNISLRSQTITFGAIADILISGTPPALSATASSGLAVVFTSATTGVCTVSGTTVTLVAPGTCTINANQAGDGTYAAASQVQQSFGVSYRSQTVSFDALTGATLGVSRAPLIRGSASSGLAVTYSSTTPRVCTVSGTTISMLNSGTCTISASQAGNGTYSAAASVTQSFSITAKPDDGQKELMAILTLLPELASISKNIGDLAVNSMTKCVKGKLVKKVKKGAKCPKTYRKVTGS
jgi:Bacterial Ig-like domain (group 3)